MEPEIERLLRRSRKLIANQGDTGASDALRQESKALLSKAESIKVKSDAPAARKLQGAFSTNSVPVPSKSEAPVVPELHYSREHRVFYLAGVSKQTAATLCCGYGWRWNAKLKAYANGIPMLARKLSKFAKYSASKALDAAKDIQEISGADDYSGEFLSPEGLEYLPFQRAGIAASLQPGREGILIGDEMGLGKTVQAAGIINNDTSINSVLVIVPAFLRINWEKELFKWTNKIRGLTLWKAGGKAWDHSAQVVIMSYDSTGRWLREIHGKTWDLVICDECHYLKNPRAARTRRVLGGRIDKVDIRSLKARRRLMLTGTPISNHPLEALSIAKFCDPVGWADSVSSFSERYGSSVDSARNLRELHTRLRQSIMVRRMKKDVLTELPPKRRQVIEVEPDSAAKAAMAKEQSAFKKWQEVRKSFKTMRAEKASVTDQDYRAKLRQLRKGRTAAWAMLARMRKQVGLEKVPWIIAAIEEILDTGEQLIVFCHHQVVARKIEEHFGKRSVLVNGSISAQGKDEAVEAFQDPDSDVKLFIGGLKSAGVGLTLVAASTVMFAELDWTPAVLSQAEDRAHRIGQLNPVLVQHIVLAESLDAHMSQKLIAKQEMTEQSLNVEVDEGPVFWKADFFDQPELPFGDM